MTDSVWVVVSSRGVERISRGAKTGGRRRTYAPRERPSLKAGEYAVLIKLVVPDGVFKPAPLPEATLEISEASLIAAPVTITVEDPPVSATNGEVVQ